MDAHNLAASVKILSGYQWTLTQKTALAMTNLIAVTLALALSRLPMLMKPLVAWCRHRRGKRRPINPDHAISDGITLGAVAERKHDVDELRRASLVLRAQSYRRRLFEEIEKAKHLLLP